MSKPQVGESTNQLLRRLVETTERLVVPAVVESIPEAPLDGGSYVRKNGQWIQAPEAAVDGVVETYAELPIGLGSPNVGDVFIVTTASGVYFVNRHPAGLYVRQHNNGNLADWVYAGDLTDSEA